MTCRPIAAALLVTGLLTAVHALQAPPPVEWIRQRAIPLQTVVAGNGFADMQPLRQVVGDARVVALGEATHGSREIFQLKHRMLEFLATEMGFSIFSIEANMPEAYRLNDYVLTGAGDPAALLKGMYFWTWDTEEVLEMIRWMREFNASGRGRLQFTGFDMQATPVAAEIVRTFVAGHSPELEPAVREAVNLARATGPGGGNAFGVATGTFPLAAAAGKRIKYRGYIRTEGADEGWAALWWRVDGKSGTLAFDNMQGKGARGTTDWREYVIELPVDAAAININFGVLMPASGRAWFDNLSVEIDGRRFTDPNVFDFDFESPSLKGLRGGGTGYRVGIDATVAQSGKQSLLIERVQQPSTPADVGARWREIGERLEAARSRYRAANVADRDIDWAIQNARIVRQGVEFQTSFELRDRFMADNVTWILDQNPKAKVVLWAHNGHVSKSRFGMPFEPMGQHLRRTLGSQMVVFGFSFNRGSFQAMSQSAGSLKDFTVPPAPAGSLDATLASAGLPLFALDLRQAPDWFRTPHGSRQIGSMYPDDQPFAFMADLVAPDAYDAVLFIDATTAARKNAGR